MLHSVNPEAVRAIRLNAGLSPLDLAERAQIGKATVYRIENGTHTPRVKTLAAIAAALGVPVSALLASHEARRAVQ